jgi:putative (di)nucleoside polyphosphate hydrolase
MSMTGGMRALWCTGRGQNQRVKSLSCGILVLNSKGQLLLCHATGTFVWDIPKGGGEAGETPLQTALRETAEECGLRFEPAELLELGRFAYRPAKDLHLFAALVDGVEARDCHCSSHFSDHWGRRRPEMDGFEWTAFERVHRRCARRMGELLTQRLSLPRVLQQLQQRKIAAPSGPKA